MLLPPGDWDRRNLVPMAQMIEMRKKLRSRKETSLENLEKAEKDAKCPEKHKVNEQKKVTEKPPRNPLKRTSIPFGGLIDDIKYRYKDYFSDIKDGLNAQCVAATIFIYFAALSGAIAFGDQAPKIRSVFQRL